MEQIETAGHTSLKEIYPEKKRTREHIEWSVWSRAGPEVLVVELDKRDRVIGL